mgnify:CR=1 FL=1
MSPSASASIGASTPAAVATALLSDRDSRDALIAALQGGLTGDAAARSARSARLAALRSGAPPRPSSAPSAAPSSSRIGGHGAVAPAGAPWRPVKEEPAPGAYAPPAVPTVGSVWGSTPTSKPEPLPSSAAPAGHPELDSGRRPRRTQSSPQHGSQRHSRSRRRRRRRDASLQSLSPAATPPAAA